MNYVTHCINKDIASADRTIKATINSLYEYFSTSDLVTKFFNVRPVLFDEDENGKIIYADFEIVPLAENLNDTYIKISANASYSYFKIEYKDTNNTIPILQNSQFANDIYINICSDENQIKISVSGSSSTLLSFDKIFMITPVRLNTGEALPVLLFTDGGSNYLYAMLNKNSFKSAISNEDESTKTDKSGYVLLRKFTTITGALDTISFDKVFTVFGTSSIPSRFTVNNKEYFSFSNTNLCALFE